MRRFIGLFLGMLCLGALPAAAQLNSAAADMPTAELTEGARGLPAPVSPDTVRTNLWLVEALMAEITADATNSLPEAPATVGLEATRKSEANDLFRVVAGRVLTDRGYEVFLASAKDSLGGHADYILGYDVIAVDLRYPEVGRTLGLWRRWVARNIQVTANVELTRNETGRLLLAERMTRTFSDRLEDKFFEDVNSEVYDFTAAATSESGWKRRTEEIVVLGTLVALIAVYFSNTSN